MTNCLNEPLGILVNCRLQYRCEKKIRKVTKISQFYTDKGIQVVSEEEMSRFYLTVVKEVAETRSVFAALWE